VQAHLNTVRIARDFADAAGAGRRPAELSA